MVTMVQSAANWRNTHTPVDRTHSLTHLHQHSYNHNTYISLVYVSPTMALTAAQVLRAGVWTPVTSSVVILIVIHHCIVNYLNVCGLMVTSVGLCSLPCLRQFWSKPASSESGHEGFMEGGHSGGLFSGRGVWWGGLLTQPDSTTDIVSRILKMYH